MNGSIMRLFSNLADRHRNGRLNAILVVEDEPITAFESEHALEQAGYDVIATVDRLAAAAGIIRAKDVDLVVVDVDLHGPRGGLDVARRAGERGVPVLFSTASCIADARSLGLACLSKPHSPRDLIRAVHVVEALVAGRPVPQPPTGLTIFAR
jgi:DNA-binding response OmpR family regulator